MKLKYDISQYIIKTKMSSKKRVLVEGKDDKAHIKNLLDVLKYGHKIRIDTAESIKGDCRCTCKNNRAKIDKIFDQCRDSNDHKKLFFFCDREYLKFEIRNELHDFMEDHESDGNLSWTRGHSIENYFFMDDIFSKAYRFLCGSGYKTDAEKLFVKILPSTFKLVAAITLAAKGIEQSTYPAGVISWTDFTITESGVSLDIDLWKSGENISIVDKYREKFKETLPIVQVSEDLVCSRICRGHTAMLMLQRIFSACLYYVANKTDTTVANTDANTFSNIKESNVASALCEAWVQKVKIGEALYPTPLINSLM